MTMTTYNDEFPYIFSKEREDLILTDMEKNKEEMMATQSIQPLSAKKQTEFTAKFRKWLEERDGTRDHTRVYDYILNSVSGELLVHLPSSRMYGYEVFCRFEDVNEDAIRLGANKYTGKWNHYIDDTSMPVDEAIAQMISWIEPVLLKD